MLAAAALGPLALAQPVPVGAGSYTTTLPPGAGGPLNAEGQPAVPLVAEGPHAEAQRMLGLIERSLREAR